MVTGKGTQFPASLELCYAKWDLVAAPVNVLSGIILLLLPLSRTGHSWGAMLHPACYLAVCMVQLCYVLNNSSSKAWQGLSGAHARSKIQAGFMLLQSLLLGLTIATAGAEGADSPDDTTSLLVLSQGSAMLGLYSISWTPAAVQYYLPASLCSALISSILVSPPMCLQSTPTTEGAITSQWVMWVSSIMNNAAGSLYQYSSPFVQHQQLACQQVVMFMRILMTAAVPGLFFCCYEYRIWLDWSKTRDGSQQRSTVTQHTPADMVTVSMDLGGKQKRVLTFQGDSPGDRRLTDARDITSTSALLAPRALPFTADTAAMPWLKSQLLPEMPLVLKVVFIVLLSVLSITGCWVLLAALVHGLNAASR